MIYLLTIILFVMLVAVLYINQYDIISPWVISVAMFFLSTLVAAMNAKRWGMDISLGCIFVIIGALLAFGLGEKTVDKVFEKYPTDSNKRLANWSIEVPVLLTCIISALMLVGFLIVFKRAYEISLEGGNHGGLKTMFKYVRAVMVTPGNHMGRFCNHITILSQAISYIYVWILMNQIIGRSFKLKHVVYIIPIVIYLFMAAMGAGRNFLIQILAFILVASMFLTHGDRPWNLRDAIKVAILAACVIGIYLIFFLFLGYLKNGAQVRIYDILSKYIGSSIINLDEYINRQKVESIYIGEETLYGIYSVIRKFGVDLPERVYHLEQSAITNVYTALRRYISDYGYMGLFIIQVYIGSFYSIFYNIVKRQKNGILLILYGWLMQPLAVQAIEETLMVRYFNTTSVYFIAYLSISYYILIVKNKRWNAICVQRRRC